MRDNSGALVGLRNPEGSPVVKKRYYYLRDALGSVVAVTNDQGAVVRRHVYSDPYGEDVSNDTTVTGAPVAVRGRVLRHRDRPLQARRALLRPRARQVDPERPNDAGVLTA